VQIKIVVVPIFILGKLFSCSVKTIVVKKTRAHLSICSLCTVVLSPQKSKKEICVLPLTITFLT